jgi:hypothetical protein
MFLLVSGELATTHGTKMNTSNEANELSSILRSLIFDSSPHATECAAELATALATGKSFTFKLSGWTAQAEDCHGIWHSASAPVAADALVAAATLAVAAQ